MVQIKVDAVSKFGVKVDGKWVGFDKKYKPIEVKKGDVLDVEMNRNGFLIKAEKLSVERVNMLNRHYLLGKPDADVLKSHDILKGQCFNAALNFAVSSGWNLEVPEMRKRTFDLAVDLLSEVSNARYSQW